MIDEGIVGIAMRLFVQRWLAIQGQITGAFYDFFSAAPHVHFGDSFLQGLVSEPVRRFDFRRGGRRPVHAVRAPADRERDRKFLGRRIRSIRYLGVFGATVAAFVLLWIVDSVFRHYRRGMGIILFSTCALSMTEQALQALPLTGGLVPLLLVGMSAPTILVTKVTCRKST